jgi:hypothetical protein
VRAKAGGTTFSGTEFFTGACWQSKAKCHRRRQTTNVKRYQEWRALVNFYLLPLPSTLAHNAIGNGMSGLISGFMGGFMGVLMDSRQRRRSQT